MCARQDGKKSCSHRGAKIRGDWPGPGRLTPGTSLGWIALAAAVGFNARALGEPGDDALALYVKSDAMWVGTKSARKSDMVATQGDVTRVRLTLEGERAFAFEGARFTPSAEVAPGAR